MAAVLSGAASSAVAMEDLIEGLHEWRNIQDIVRVTFKAFHDILKHQGETIRRLESALESKAGKTEVAAALSHKANAADVNARVTELQVGLSRKADSSDLTAAMGRCPTRADVSAAVAGHAGEVHVLLDQHRGALSKEVADVREAAEHALTSLRGAIEQQSNEGAQLAARLDEKVGLSDMETAVARAREGWRADKDATTEEVRASMTRASTAVRDEVRVLSTRVQADGDATTRALRALSSTFDGALAEMREVVRVQEEKAIESHSKLSEAVAELTTIAATRAGLQEVREIVNLTTAEVGHMACALKDKVSSSTIQQLETRLEPILDGEAGPLACSIREEVETRLARKADKMEMMAALERCASVAEVNHALAEVSSELDQRPTKADVSSALAVSSSCCNACAGRWTWVSGKLTVALGGAGRAHVRQGPPLVPWNRQSLNTGPQELLWEENEPMVTVVTGGLYEVCFGFFTRKKPQVQLLVDGEPLVAAVNGASYVVHHSSGRMTGVGGHTRGATTGLTLIDFLLLPAQAHLAISYHPSPTLSDSAEGFLSLRRL